MIVRVTFLLLWIAQFGFSQDLDYVREQSRILSSIKMKGRGYVGNGLNKAAKQISNEFEAMGLKSFEGDYCQKFSQTVNTFPGKVTLSVASKKLVPGKDFIIDPSSPAYKGKGYARIISAAEFGTLPQPSELKSTCGDCIVVLDMRDLKDKKVLKDARQLKYLYSEVAPVIWLRDEKFTWGVSDRQLKFPVIECGSIAINQGQEINLRVDAKLEPDFQSMNLLAFVPGTSNPDSLVLFTAHFDHLGMMGKKACFYGANDNASGTAYILSLAKHYAENPAEYTTVFIAFGGEEAGLIGSKYLVEHPLFELDKIRFLVNLDLMGSGVDGITVVNAPDNNEEYELLVKINEEQSLIPKVKSRGQAANSDHYHFAQKGVPAVFIYALGGSQAYHDIYDVNDNLTFEEYTDIFTLLKLFVKKL